MNIGVIFGHNNKGLVTDCHHSGYYISGLSKLPRIDKIFSNSPDLKTSYNWFLVNQDKIVLSSIEEIENMDLDFVIYGYYSYIKDRRVPAAKSPRVQFIMRDSVYQKGLKMDLSIIEASDYVFKISLPKDKAMLCDKNIIPPPFKHCGIPDKLADKFYPLFYVGSNSLEYPNDCHFSHNIGISFIGSITSKDRVNAVNKIKSHFGINSHVGFSRDTRKKGAVDEDGFYIYELDAQADPLLKIKHNDYLKLMRKSTVSLSPAGFGRNTHRFIDILCMGGMALVADISHIDYGPVSPVEDIHYMQYSRSQDDLIDKAGYLINNPEIAENIGAAAKDFMEKTYLNNGLMAETYIIDVLEDK